MLEQRRRGHRAGAHRTGGRLLAVLAILLVLLAVAAAIQLSRGVPAVRAQVTLAHTITVPGPAPTLSWPRHAAAALAIDGLGSLGGVRTGRTRPLASVAKLLTALVVLREHPLKPGQSGPVIPITSADAAAYRADAAAHDSVLRVRAGEHLTELEALEGMLIPSADNLARLLARWSSGNSARFVNAMNQEAATLGLRHTHLAGPSGLNPASVGTAADMVKLAQAVMANPVLRRIVAMPAVTLPAAGTVYNLDDVLGRDGIVGIKTGSTASAGGNFVFAARRRVDGSTVTVLGAILGATGVDALQNALDTGARLAAQAARALHRELVLRSGQTVLRLRAPWGPSIPARAARSAALLALAGSRVRAQVTLSPALAHGRFHRLRAGQRVATVVLRADGHTISVPVTASRPLPGPSLSYRLLRL